MVKTRSCTKAGDMNDETRELFPAEVSDDEVQGPESKQHINTKPALVVFAWTSVLIVCIIASAVFLYSWFGPGLADVDGYFDYHWAHSARFGIAAFLVCTVVSAVLGLGCCFFSYTVTYFDSMRPGQNPPTPMSPQGLRKQSGHNFHMGYAMSVLNGAAFFSYCLWSLRGYFWTTPES